MDHSEWDCLLKKNCQLTVRVGLFSLREKAPTKNRFSWTTQLVKLSTCDLQLRTQEIFLHVSNLDPKNVSSSLNLSVLQLQFIPETKDIPLTAQVETGLNNFNLSLTLICSKHQASAALTNDVLKVDSSTNSGKNLPGKTHFKMTVGRDFLGKTHPSAM